MWMQFAFEMSLSINDPEYVKCVGSAEILELEGWD